MTWYPHVTVATIVEKSGKFLFVEEWSHGKLVINQPAGHLEQGETLQQAALRETLEETAWDVRLTGVASISLYTSPENNVAYNRHCFVAEPVKHHQDAALDDGIERTLWLTLDELKQRTADLRSPLVLKTLEAYLENGCQPLHMVLNSK